MALTSRHVITIFYTLLITFCYVENETLAWSINKDSIIGGTAELECNLDLFAKDMKWEHVPRIGARPAGVTIGTNLLKKYADRFSLDLSSGYTLIIGNVQREDAGEYLCREEHEDPNHTVQIQLTVLETAPICQTSINFEEVVSENNCEIDPDYFTMSCHVNYFGNVAPVLTWKGVDDTNKNVTIDGNRVSNTIVVRARWNPLDVTAVTCQTSLLESKCFSAVPKMSYIFDTTTYTRLQEPQVVTCSANSSQECRYKWIKDGAVVSQHAKLNLTSESSFGKYRCVAECNIRGKSCEVQPRVVNYASDMNIIQVEHAVIIILAILLIVLLLIIFKKYNFHTKCWEMFKSKENINGDASKAETAVGGTSAQTSHQK